jgi:perosamine synthetase
MKYIPQIEPWIGQEELEELTEVISSTFITENRKTEQFLDEIKTLTGASYAIATSNGTLALVAALIASGVKTGDRVIVPDLTFIASSNAVRLVGATPVFCDVDRRTGCMDIDSVARLITPDVKAIMPVHLYGQIVDMEPLMTLASHYSIDVIEDAAEALGVRLKGQHAGTFGRFGTFSFFANKTITCGEGGVVLCKTEADYKKLYRIKNHGRDRKGIFVHDSIGFNFCFTDLQAAVGLAQLRKFEKIMLGKKRVFELYSEGLDGIKGIQLIHPPKEVDSNYWFINVLVDDPEELGEYLDNEGVGSRRFFYPLFAQPCNKDLQAPRQENSEWLYQHGLSLPSSPRLGAEDVSRVCNAVIKFLELTA